MGIRVERRHAAEERAKKAFGSGYDQLNFPAASAALDAESERRDLLAALAERAPPTCSGTKIASGLSPGCAICVAGGWSCLFINGRCNARCFYCPTAQDDVGEPVTNRLAFPKSQEYLEYLARFGFRGMSVSGGEPLLTLPRTLQFLRAVKERFGDKMHCWLYTNGTLLDTKIVRQLRDVGLDELRFDIGATNYNLDKVALAAGVIDCVTVEVPAVPEEFEQLAAKLPAMADIGVSHLNLHQLRLTPHNFSQLMKRGYTFAHGEAITVLDSELAALRLVLCGVDQELPLGINYCSALYKSRFQQWAARRRSAHVVKRPREDVTAGGYLRQMHVSGTAAEIDALDQRLESSGAARESWLVQGERLSFAAAIWPLLQPHTQQISVRYTTPSIVPAVRYAFPFVEVALGRRRKIAVERTALSIPFELGPAQSRAFFGRYLDAKIAGADRLKARDEVTMDESLDAYERIEDGLQDYY